jgi:hypothetical protein
VRTRQYQERPNRERNAKGRDGDLAEVSWGNAGEVEPARRAGAGEEDDGGKEEAHQRRVGRRHGIETRGEAGWEEDGEGAKSSLAGRSGLCFDLTGVLGGDTGFWSDTGTWALRPVQFAGALLASRDCRAHGLRYTFTTYERRPTWLRYDAEIATWSERLSG